jgi:hypothetical protein
VLGLKFHEDMPDLMRQSLRPQSRSNDAGTDPSTRCICPMAKALFGHEEPVIGNMQMSAFRFVRVIRPRQFALAENWSQSNQLAPRYERSRQRRIFRRSGCIDNEAQSRFAFDCKCHMLELDLAQPVVPQSLHPFATTGHVLP